MAKVTVVIPNYNGIKYIGPCLDAMEKQTSRDFDIVVVDNGSTDGSFEKAKSYPSVNVIEMGENTGFTGAVNAGIDEAKRRGSEFVILLNNDTEAHDDFVQELICAISKDKKLFSCQAKMLMAKDPELMDDGGDFYCALGWAFARGSGKKETKYKRDVNIFYSCGGAAIYRLSAFEKTGEFDNRQFAYLEDCDIGWRAKIFGYENSFASKALVKHVGSGASGSKYNEFKISHSAANSIYIIYKNMPVVQLIINMPFLIAGFLIKQLFFVKKGFGTVYFKGILRGFKMCREDKKYNKKVHFEGRHLKNYFMIQIDLWINIFRRLREFV